MSGMRTASAEISVPPHAEGNRAPAVSTSSKPPGDGAPNDQRIADGNHQRHSQSPRSTAPRQVLLIEDDDVSGEMLRAGLQNLSIVCTWVKTVDEARRALEKRTFDAVVTDIMLGPDSPSGLDLVKELQPTGAPVLVITAFADTSRVKEALNHGATFLLEKPFRAEELSRALASVWEEPRGLGHFVERALDRAELTAKERDVARLLLKGLSTREMAGVTGNTEKTLKHHIASIFHKFGVASRAELFHCIFPT
ncbi:MAG TPA: response regulator transcription factor [Polyangiaceae bacterium]|nr:response regulator transcription factor [Polyangiaceae bacterium]